VSRTEAIDDFVASTRSLHVSRKHQLLDVYTFSCQATVEGYTGGTQLDIRFSNAYFEFGQNPFTKQELDTPVRLPYPVPFRLLPNESRYTYFQGALYLLLRPFKVHESSYINEFRNTDRGLCQFT